MGVEDGYDCKHCGTFQTKEWFDMNGLCDDCCFDSPDNCSETFETHSDGHFEIDSAGLRCWWDAEDEGWYTELDERWVSNRMKQLMENHPQFVCWARQCDCGSKLPAGRCDVCLIDLDEGGEVEKACWLS